MLLGEDCAVGELDLVALFEELVAEEDDAVAGEDSGGLAVGDAGGVEGGVRQDETAVGALGVGSAKVVKKRYNVCDKIRKYIQPRSDLMNDDLLNRSWEFPEPPGCLSNIIVYV